MKKRKSHSKHAFIINITIILMLPCVMALTGCQRGADSPQKPMDQAEIPDNASAEDGRTESGNEKLLSEGKADAGDRFSEGRQSGEIGKARMSESDGFEAQGDGQEPSEAALRLGGTDKASEAAGASGEAQEPVGSEAAASDMPETAPKLPETGEKLSDFVPEGWELHDSAELDFNGDGIPDYVAVLQLSLVDMGDYHMYQEGPRILFAIMGEGAGGYRLDFQDSNLIRTRDEGGVFGDPYLPLTAEGNSFTTHTFGGSAWKWSEDFTYTYRDGTWYLTMSESTYGYGPYTTSYDKDDWERGVGTRKRRSDEFSDMEKYWDSQDSLENPVYDIEYEITLDEPPTLYQAGMRWWLAPDRVSDWTVESLDCAAGVEIPADRVKRPDEVYLGDCCDEDGVLYAFLDEESGCHYLARYCWQDRGLRVLAQESSPINSMEIYKGKIYYATEVVETVTYRLTRDGQEQVEEKEDAVGIRLNRLSLDGTGKESIFEYRYPGADQEIMDGWPPYLALIYEIGGDEIVAEVYVGSEPHPVYRMAADGSGLRLIGQIPSE